MRIQGVVPVSQATEGESVMRVLLENSISPRAHVSVTYINYPYPYTSMQLLLHADLFFLSITVWCKIGGGGGGDPP